MYIQVLRSVVAYSIAGALLARCGLAQELKASPQSVGLNPARLKVISEVVQSSVGRGEIAGAVTLVARHGQVVWLNATGFQDRESHKSMRTDSIFRICSMTKPIVSLAAMMLYEEGRFQLDDPISKFIPEFKDQKVLVTPKEGKPYTIPASKPIKIRNLLTHTSGLTYNWDPVLGLYYKDANIAAGLMPYNGTIADNVKQLARLPLLFNPGEKWNYGLSIDVLGYLVEIVSGKPLDQFLKERIFEPLGMHDTFFYVPEDKQDRLATVYTWYEGKGLQRFPETPIVEGSFSYLADYPIHGPKKLFAGERACARRRPIMRVSAN